MGKEKSFSRFNAVSAVAVCAVTAAMVYLVIRSVLLWKSKYTPIDGGLAILLILAEIFIIFHSVGYTLNILRVRFSIAAGKVSFPSREIDPQNPPPVAILVPARNEPRDVLERTFLTINNINYKNKKVYFLDDSVNEKHQSEAAEIARDQDLTLFRRDKPWHGAKAGIVNDCLAQLTEKYIVVFDADQNPMPDFLSALVPMMEADEKLAFIQTPQFYTNIEKNRVARAAMLQQAVFYEYICEGKGVSDSMFCCGTNVIFRASALKGVGGMDESSVTEDFATSLKFHTQGYRSLYSNRVHAFGMGPEDLSAYFKQQFRWAMGTIGVLRKVLLKFLTRPFSLKMTQWIEYFLSSTYYFTGIAFFVLMICPMIFIFFKVPSFFASPAVYFMAFLPYIILSMSIFYFALRKRHYKPRDLISGQLLGAMTFLVYVKAAVAGLLDIKLPFGVTPKKSDGSVPYRTLWPQISMCLMSFIAVVWAFNRYYYEHNPALLVNGFWAFYHFMVFSSIFYFNQGEK